MARPPNYSEDEVADFIVLAMNSNDLCCEWPFGISAGYPAYRGVYMHRYICELVNGPFPEEYVVDHLCRNILCMNPNHLEAITTGENTRRGMLGKTLRRIRRSKTHCKRGHKWTADNTYWVSGKDQRQCLECRRMRGRKEI